MLSVKRLPALSVSKVQAKLNIGPLTGTVQKEINKHCHNNIIKLCRSFSVLHNLTSKRNNPVSPLHFYFIKATFKMVFIINLPHPLI